MPSLEGMSLKEVVAGFPDLGHAVDCIRPFMEVFGERIVFLEKQKHYFMVDSTQPLPWINTAIQRWEARFDADGVAACGYERSSTSSHTWKCVWSQRFSLDECSVFLGKVMDHQKKSEKPRGGRKPASSRPAPTRRRRKKTNP